MHVSSDELSSKAREAGVDANVISEAEEILKVEAVSATEPGAVGLRDLMR